MKDGIWLGVNERTEANIIGILEGVVKCRTIKRRYEGQQWDSDLLSRMKGSASQPVPGVLSDRIRTAVIDAEGRKAKTSPSKPASFKYVPKKGLATRLAKAPRALKIFKKDVEKYGPTLDCVACTNAIMARGSEPKGTSYITPNNSICRLRMAELVRGDEVDRFRVQKAEERLEKSEEERQTAMNESGRFDKEEANPSADTLSSSHELIEPESSGEDIPETDPETGEQETEVAIRVQHGDDIEFKKFINSIQVGCVQAVAENEVSEVYSVPRVAEVAKRMGLNAGWALDICSNDEEGNPWDFTKPEMRNKVARKVIEEEPLVLIGSPPYTDWSSLMNFNWSKLDPATVEERKRIARTHLEFCAKLYKIQHVAGRYFLHEHPISATSWSEEIIREVCDLDGVLTALADQCKFGLTSPLSGGQGELMKPTRFMTNSLCIAQSMNRRCPNRMTHGTHKHEHVILLDGRAKAAQTYPNELCRAIRKGIVKQIEADRQGQFMLAALDMGASSKTAMHAAMELASKCKQVEEDDAPELEDAYDDVSGAPLDPQNVFEARMEEVKFIRDMKLYDKVPIE